MTYSSWSWQIPTYIYETHSTYIHSTHTWENFTTCLQCKSPFSIFLFGLKSWFEVWSLLTCEKTMRNSMVENKSQPRALIHSILCRYLPCVVLSMYIVIFSYVLTKLAGIECYLVICIDVIFPRIKFLLLS